MTAIDVFFYTFFVTMCCMIVLAFHHLLLRRRNKKTGITLVVYDEENRCWFEPKNRDEVKDLKRSDHHILDNGDEVKNFFKPRQRIF